MNIILMCLIYCLSILNIKLIRTILNQFFSYLNFFSQKYNTFFQFITVLWYVKLFFFRKFCFLMVVVICLKYTNYINMYGFSLFTLFFRFVQNNPVIIHEHLYLICVMIIIVKYFRFSKWKNCNSSFYGVAFILISW